ncbi:MAG: MBL fold metallo-hydrolase [Limnochordia bacterium]|jgi:Cft2 family RNA processing exonuclease
MRIAILGGGNEVGASCIHIDLGDCKLLIDAGIRMGGGVEYGAPQDSLPDLARIDELGGVDAIYLTHAHLDHSGALPLVHQAYPKAPIYCTRPTHQLIGVLLADALKIMEQKAEREMEVPLYDVGLVNSMFARVVPVEVTRAAPLPQDLGIVHFFPAGHILGASLIGIESKVGNVLVSGDVSVLDQRTILGMSFPRFDPNVLILESTYGNRMHANRLTEEKRLARAVAEIIQHGGRVLIPAFALGRAQEVILILWAMQQAGEIPDCPIWVDGMVRSICDIYSNFAEYLCPNLRRKIEAGGNPFFQKGSRVQPVRNAKQRERIVQGPPCCIVASSGMLSGGPSQYYAEKLASGMHNAIFLTGYQDEESPGRRLLDLAAGRSNRLVLGDKQIEVVCMVQQFGLSAHADGGELVSLTHQLKPDHTILVHGDDDARAHLAERLTSTAVYLVENGDELQFSFPRRASSPELKQRQGIGKGLPLNIEALWLYIVSETALAKRLFSATELADLWYGHRLEPAQVEALTEQLQNEQAYFAQDWQRPFLYYARTKAAVANQARRRQLMNQAPELIGKLLLLRAEDGSLDFGICYGKSSTGFSAWQVGKNSTEFPAEALITIVGPWDIADGTGSEEKSRLADVIQKGTVTYRRFTGRRLWEAVFQAYKNQEFTLDAAMDACGLSMDLAHRLAIAKRLVTSADFVYYRQVVPGENRYGALPETVVPQECQEDLTRLESNAAMSLVDELFPAETGLYKRGAHVDSGTLSLYFHFPDVAQVRYAGRLRELEELSGWQVEVNTNAHHGALNQVLLTLLPGDCLPKKGPSIYADEKKVLLQCTLPKDVPAAKLVRKFKEETGFELVLAEETPSVVVEPVNAAGDKQWEINQAFRLIKEHFKWLGVEIYKHSKKTSPDGTGYIQLAFISPEIGGQYAEDLDDLSREIGWPIVIAEEPNQHAIKMAAIVLMQRDWGLLKEPSFFKGEQRVEVKLSQRPDEKRWLEAVSRFKAKTGYDLEYTI